MTKVVRTLTTNMKGFQRWMQAHPRKRVDGFFSFAGKEMTHEQIRRVVDYAVEKGYRTETDIPEEEIKNILKEMKI